MTNFSVEQAENGWILRVVGDKQPTVFRSRAALIICIQNRLGRAMYEEVEGPWVPSGTPFVPVPVSPMTPLAPPYEITYAPVTVPSTARPEPALAPVITCKAP